MTKRSNPTLTTKAKFIRRNILDAASELDSVTQRDCVKRIKELEAEIFKYKQLSWFLHTAQSHNIKFSGNILQTLNDYTIELLEKAATGHDGYDVKYWAECVKTYNFLEKHVKEQLR